MPESLKSVLAEHAGQADIRLLEAFYAAAAPDAGGGPLRAAKADVVARLKTTERKDVSDDLVRQRLSQLTGAAIRAGLIGAQSKLIRADRGFLLLDEKGALEAAKQADAREQMVAAVRAEIGVPKEHLIPPRAVAAALTQFQVFMSHAWDREAVEKLLDEFREDLQRKLDSPPPARKKRLTVKLWFDRKSMPDTAQTFDQATVPACQQSSVALFMLSGPLVQQQGVPPKPPAFGEPMVTSTRAS